LEAYLAGNKLCANIIRYPRFFIFKIPKFCIMNNFRVAYHASHEQFPPSELLKLAVMAEQAGFNALHCSDHFQPWSNAQGESGFAFAWLGAAMQATNLPCGLVCAPGQRYHPAIVAQALATLAEMFPERVWASLGSGEAINETITGEPWPAKPERNQRLLESYDIISRLLDGETLRADGLVKMEEAKLYTLPKVKPLLVGAAVSAATAGWMGGWADGMVTINKPLPELQEVVDSFRKGGGEGKPIFLKVQISYDRDYDKALQGAFDQWRTNIIDPSLLGDLTRVSQFEAAAQFIKPEHLLDFVHISSDLSEHLANIQAYKDMGFETIVIHNVNRNQETFIQDFGSAVLPKLL
jgi:probable non-F420 flavinoid oxidoreductase